MSFIKFLLMKLRDFLSERFTLGFIAAACVMSLMQDFNGLDATIQAWRPANETVPLALAGLCLVLALWPYSSVPQSFEVGEVEDDEEAHS